MAAGADEAAIARIFELLNAECSLADICRAVCNCDEDAAEAAQLGPRKQDLLKLLLGALELLGPRVFLQCTAHLVDDAPALLPPLDLCRLPSKDVRRKVAIYGGAFDPITMAHLTCAAELVHSSSADEVWLVPCGPRSDKPKLTPAKDRYCMCQVAVNTAFSQRFPVRVSDVECFAAEALFTYDLLCKLRDDHPEVHLSFVIGTDWLQPGSNMCEWTSRNWDWKPGDPEDQRTIVTGHRMLQEFNFLVIKRPGYEVPEDPDDPSGLKQFGPRLSWLVMPAGTTFIEGNLSSTEIRKRGSRTVRDAVGNRSLHLIEGLVPRSVLAYIRRHGFYQDGFCPHKKGGRVAIFGGAFDPITNSHLTCVAQILHSGSADEVWLVPCGPRPDKKSLKTSPLDRYCMCKIAVNQMFSCSFPVYVNDVECFGEEPLFTYDLLCKLKEMNPHLSFTFIIGSDWLQPQTDMSAWTSRNWDWKPGDPEDERTIVTGRRMLTEFDFLVIPRPGYEVEMSERDSGGLKRFGPRLKWLKMPPSTTFIHGNLSSSEIRKRTSVDAKVRDLGLSAVEGLIPSGVLAYIGRQNLYLQS